MWKMRIHHVLAGLAILALAWGQAKVSAEEEQNDDVLKVLRADNFWETSGQPEGHQWTAGELRQLEELAKSSKDAVVRLRANKVLVDSAGRARYDADDLEIVSAGFRYLERRLKEADVKKLCAEQGFTHYTVSSAVDGRRVFLIEHVQSRGFNGGLNLNWDQKRKSITGMQAWGAVSNP